MSIENENEVKCEDCGQVPGFVKKCEDNQSCWRLECKCGDKGQEFLRSQHLAIAQWESVGFKSKAQQQTTPTPTPSRAQQGSTCECLNWCETDHRIAFLTGHHSRCPHGGNPLEAAYKLLKELTRGIECWAAEEDGEVYADCWKPYRIAKALEGVYLPEEPEKS